MSQWVQEAQDATSPRDTSKVPVPKTGDQESARPHIISKRSGQERRNFGDAPVLDAPRGSLDNKHHRKDRNSPPVSLQQQHQPLSPSLSSYHKRQSREQSVQQQQQQQERPYPSHEKDIVQKAESMDPSHAPLGSSTAKKAVRYNAMNEKAVESLDISTHPLSKPNSGARHSNGNHYLPSTTKVEETPTHPSIDPARLDRVRSSVQPFLSQRYSVHEYTVPRLFIVLPDPVYEAAELEREAAAVTGAGEDPSPGTPAAENGPGKISSGTKSPGPGQSPISNDEKMAPRFRLFFLCECSPSFTLPLGSGLNHLHIAKHVGYAVDPGRSEEFFVQYGSTILTLLIYLKYGYDPIASANMPAGVAQSTRRSSAQPLQQTQVRQDTAERDGLENKESSPKRVEKLSGLKPSDLPESISRDIDDRVDWMVEYLDTFLEAYKQDVEEIGVKQNTGDEDYNAQSSASTSSSSLGSESKPVHMGELGSASEKNNLEESKIEAGEGAGADQSQEDLADKKAQRLVGLASLSDLHHLYSFLGLANANARMQAGQLGNLFRISNVRGQVSWVCIYHYRWTFLEKNIDEFERWVITRGGLFDKQSGSVSIALVSRAHTRTFCSWIANKVAPSLVEVHLKLAWKFGKKDLWRLAKALANSTVTVLSLDGCSSAEDSTYMSLHKKYDPLLHLLSYGQLHSLELSRFPSLFARLSHKSFKSPTLRRLEFGHGMSVDNSDRASLSNFLLSCSALQELMLPGFAVTDMHVQAILAGIRSKSTLVTLNLSGSGLDDGGAIILAQGLYNTSICHLDLSRNEDLSDMGAARVVRAIGPRLASLKMAQTGFGDLAASALAKSMDGISFSHALRDQLQLQHRLDIAALTAGHRPGIRVRVDAPISSELGGVGAPNTTGYSSTFAMKEMKTQTHPVGHLVYLDIEDNKCTEQGFRSLASISSRLYFVYLNLSGSKELEDTECAQLLSKVASSELVTLRLACTGFGDQSAKALAQALMERPPIGKRPSRRLVGMSQLEELDLQACPIGPEGFMELQKMISQTRVEASLRVLDVGHCSSLQDEMAQALIRTLMIPNGIDYARAMAATAIAGNRNRKPQSPGASSTSHSGIVDQLSVSEQSEGAGVGRLTRSNTGTGPTAGVVTSGALGEFHVMAPQFGRRFSTQAQSQMQQGRGPIPQRSDSLQAIAAAAAGIEMGEGSEEGLFSSPQMELLSPSRLVIPLAHGFFTNLRQLDLKSTWIGDGTAWLLAQALAQPWIMIESLTILDPVMMSIEGLCWIIDTIAIENMTVTELGIGKSGAGALTGPELELFGIGLSNLLELNRRIRTLTTLGAPLGAIAKGLLLNQSLHSIYLIQSRGIPDDMNLMGQALAFNRALLVIWMGGSDEALLGLAAPSMGGFTHESSSAGHIQQTAGGLPVLGDDNQIFSSPLSLSVEQMSPSSDRQEQQQQNIHGNLYPTYQQSQGGAAQDNRSTQQQQQQQQQQQRMQQQQRQQYQKYQQQYRQSSGQNYTRRHQQQQRQQQQHLQLSQQQKQRQSPSPPYQPQAHAQHRRRRSNGGHSRQQSQSGEESVSRRIGKVLRSALLLGRGHHKTHRRSASLPEEGGGRVRNLVGTNVTPATTLSRFPTIQTVIGGAGEGNTAGGGGGGGGGTVPGPVFAASYGWARNPIVEGIRRNHSLIKVTLDPIVPSRQSTASGAVGVTGALSRSNSMNGSVLNHSHFNNNSGYGPDEGHADYPNTSHHNSHNPSNATHHNHGQFHGHNHHYHSSGGNYDPTQLEQMQIWQHHQLYKKVMANRKLLKERGRVGCDELKLLGLDDDIIREVCFYG